MNHVGFDRVDEELMSGDPAKVSPSHGSGESELQFFSRRAMEESRLAKTAATPQAAAAHAYLAGAYSAQVAREIEKQTELERLLLAID